MVSLYLYLQYFGFDEYNNKVSVHFIINLTKVSHCIFIIIENQKRFIIYLLIISVYVSGCFTTLINN